MPNIMPALSAGPYSARVRSRLVAVHSIFENPVDFINSPVYRDGCEFSGIFPENPVGLAGLVPLSKICDAEIEVSAEAEVPLCGNSKICLSVTGP